MKKLLVFVLTLVCILGLIGCSQKEEVQQSGNKLTLDKVVELSTKGEKLTWSDFEQYESIETGSGLYILVYEIDETFDLWIGGGTLDDAPMYIRLVTKANKNNCIDIRTGDIKEFIEANEK